MLIDIRTMFVVLAITSLLLALTLAYAFPGARDGLGKWVLGLIAQALAWTLFATRGINSEMLVVVVGNLLFSLGVAFKAASLMEFQKRRAPLWLPLALPVTIAAVFLALLDHPRSQLIFNGLAYCLMYAGLTWLLLAPPHTTSQRIRYLMILAFGSLSAGFLVRTIVNGLSLDPALHPLGPGPLESFSHIYGFIVLLASSAGVLLMHKERADEKARQLAGRDPLTGVYNRRIFIELADMALARAQRSQKPLSLLMLDLDHFKSVNDEHGHLVGDEVLKSFVRVVETCLRREDLMVRFGGEEFCVMLPDASLEGALSLAERIRALVADTPLPVQGKSIHITVSFGVDCIRPGEPGTVNMLLERADAALIRAKQTGRNRVASYFIPSPP